ncbi:MAG: radical SAM protein [Clostridia bacterium]|nr:radical SAM protein [Clostridia bacterium]
MDEQEKKLPQENGGKNHGRRRRHRHGHGHGQNSENNAAVKSAPAQNTQSEKNVINASGGQAQAKAQNHAENRQGGSNNPKNQQKQGAKPQQQQKQKPVQAQKQSGQGAQKSKQKNKGEKKNEQQRKDTYVYVLDGNLYFNLTNKCSNACDFCVRNERTSYYGNYLWLQKGEPTAAQVIAQINALGDLKRFKEGVFCGFGEPTYRMEVMAEVADFLHEKGIATRLNTNGQGNLINKRDIVPELQGKIDLVNVSLNASCYEKYQKICRSQFREAGFDGMVEFAKSCKRQGVNVRFSIVDCIGEEEVEACKRLAASVNVPLYIRDYITDS